MYNSFIFKKHSEEVENSEQRRRREKQWASKYHSNVRPALIEKYSRRINNFVVRVVAP